MSAHFSYHQLYSAIRNNDLEALNNAVFFLGPRIHVVHVWCGRTAMEYAARLGHLEQAKLLFKDLERYFDEEYPPTERIGKVFSELVLHANRDPHFLRGLIRKYGQECVSRIRIECMVKNDAFQLLEMIAETDPETYMSKIAQAAFDHMKPDILRVEWFEQHPLFQKELQTWFEKDALHLAMMQKDTDEIKRLLLSETALEFPCVKRNCEVKPLPKIGSKKRRTVENPFSKAGLLDYAVQVNSSNVLDALISSDVLPRVVKLTINSSEQDILETMFSLAVYTESVDVVRALLTHSLFNRDQVDWHRLYYELLVAGKEKSAGAVSDLRRGYLSQQIKGRLYQALGNDKPAMRFMQPDAPESLIYQVVDAIDAFPKNRPQNSSQWRTWIADFPWNHGRPDLVAHFTQYGCSGTEEDVIRSIADKSTSAMDKAMSSWDVNCIYKDCRISSLGSSFFNSSSSTTQRLREVFLTEMKAHVEISQHIQLTDADKAILMMCVKHTGKPLKAYLYRSPYSYSSNLGNGNRQDETGIDDFVQEAETERFEALTLKKLCRISVRLQIRKVNPERSLCDSILSLFVKSLVPKPLVNYLMYRDENIHRPLFYKLIKPLHTHVYGGRGGWRGLYYDSPDPEPDDYDYYTDSDGFVHRI